MKKAASALACWLAVLVSAAGGQQLPPAFRTGIDAVQLDVSVLDGQRRPVRGLTPADFTILDNGKPRQIVAFSAVELPALPPPASSSPAGADAVPPDVTRNDLPDGRLVIILMDPFLERVMVPGRVTIADPPGISAMRATALRIVDSLGPGDVAAVAHTMYGIAQNFTTDKTRLERAIDTSAFGTNLRAEGERWGDCHCGTCRVEAITRIATALRAEPQRRKTVFFVGERLQLAPVDGSCNTYLEPATKQMVLATQLANVTVHTVDPNGVETTNVHAGDDFKPEAPGGVSGAAAAQEAANRGHLIERQQSLQTVADWTGGRAVMNTNVPEESVRPILEESSAYYLLAFQTPEVKPDGRFHPITVRVNRPDVQVRTRKGYYADAATPGSVAPGPAVSLETVARGLLPERGLPMSVAAAPFRGTAGTPIVVVATGIRASSSTPAGATAAAEAESAAFEPIEILTSAFADGQKDTEWQRQRVSIALPPSAPGMLRYESVSTLNLKPGHYELRVAVHHERADEVGSVHAFVDVPDFDSDPLTLSGVVLLDRHAPTASPPEALGGLLGSAPTTRRDFMRGDDVSALVRVYQRQQAPPSAVPIRFRLLNAEGRELSSAPTSLAADQFAAHAADARFTLPLDTLQPGSYILRVEAGGTTRRDVRFTVR